jgi:hypothetical protein
VRITQAQAAEIARHSMKIAQTLLKQRNEELVELSVHSTDFEHRVAAAWYYGLAQEPSDCLFVLMRDRHPLVSLAARESCVAIAKRKFKEHDVDFGPRLNAPQSSKEACADLWQAHFEKKAKEPRTEERKKPERPEKPKERTPAEILGIE